ncbi:ectoine/hydroxyectoine ABC transporter permease subunit EhuD [Paenibacillus harenae]|uniref:ectoine/hydroxyectoine ABC transporter permease subunit EhuD n=1 Tax=Paenibacillus harenae TaxID=306543 RepID=UPI000426D539|nr:ectoine/hydroxyectoine ABC transporter permease subunit EhuD [Paenibacillus harenae]
MWNWDYVNDLLPSLLKAFGVTLGATIAGFLLSIVIGLVFAVAARSSIGPVRWIVRAVVEFIRSTPLLVQLFFLYFSLPMLTPFAMPAFITGIIGLGLHYGTYMSEVFRSGIDAVPTGQWEASTALHLSKRKTWLSVILPQALPPVIPVMGNYLIVIFKETPTLSAITVVELLLTAKSEASITYRVFEPYTLAGLLFLVTSLLFSFGIRLLERRYFGTKQLTGGGKR